MRNTFTAAAIVTLSGLVAVPAANAGVSTLNNTVSATAVTSAQRAQTPEEERRRARLSLSQSTARTLGEVFNKINERPAQYQSALNDLNGLLNRDLSAFDRSTALELRAGVYAALENYNASIQDYTEILRLDELPFDRLKQIRFNVAQLYFAEENYAQAIRFMEEYLAGQDSVTDANAWFILAAAYSSQSNFSRARTPGENALRYAENKEKKYYDLLNLIYSELGLQSERGELLEQMVERFPNEESYWAQLSGAYSQAGQDRDAFATLEAAYKAGLIDDEQKIVALAQYYSALQNPYRGGKLIEAEMAAGTVERNLKNLELLSQLWSMAREQDKAIEALTAAARLSDNGALYYRLGQSYIASERFEEGARNLREALSRGGLSARDRGDIYVLLGSAYFSMDSDTAAGRRRAREAFQQALGVPSSRRTAQGWIQYIDAIENTIRRQNEVERAQRIESREREVERCVDIIELAEIGGVTDRNQLEECRGFVAEIDVDGNGDLDDDEIRAYTRGEPAPAPETASGEPEGEEEEADAEESAG